MMMSGLFDESLERHLKELAPADSAVIEEYARTIPVFARNDFTGEAMAGSMTRTSSYPTLMAARPSSTSSAAGIWTSNYSGIAPPPGR